MPGDINDNHMMYDSPPPNLVKLKFWKQEKIPYDIIISHRRTINGDHMMYGF